MTAIRGACLLLALALVSPVMAQDGAGRDKDGKRPPPPTCKADSDCSGKCGPDAKGCACHTTGRGERREDIVPLARALLAQIAGELGHPALQLTGAAERWLEARPWPGNVRQLRNVLERGAILTGGDAIDVDSLPPDEASEATPAASARLRDLEREAIVEALAATDGNRRRAAEKLGISLRTLYNKLNRYGIG